MSWIEEGKFSLSNSPSGRKYVFRRKANGVKLEINVPSTVTTRTQAQMWLRTHYKSPVVPAGRKKFRIPLINLSKPTPSFLLKPHFAQPGSSFKGSPGYMPTSLGSPKKTLASPVYNTGYNSNGKPKPFYGYPNSPLYGRKVPGFKKTTPYGSVNENAPRYTCNITKNLYHRVAENYSIGFNQMNVNNKSNNTGLIQIKKTMARKGMAKLDTGKQGTVYLASFRRRAPPGSEFVLKVSPFDKRLKSKPQVAAIEDKIQRALYAVVPGHIPKPLAPMLTCENFVESRNLLSLSATPMGKPYKNYEKQSVMFSEYISNGPFPKYIQKIAASPRKRLNDRFMRSVISQVLTALYKIRRTYPGFRHNDLHLENILVKPGKPYPIMVLNDFGYATLDDKVKNPTVTDGDFSQNWGIGPKTSPLYDVHLFLNEMRKECLRYKSKSTDGFKKTLAFLNEMIPSGYRENTNKYTLRMRLRYGVNYPGILNLKQILATNYLKNVKTSRFNVGPYTSANLIQVGLSPNSRNWALGRNKKKSPSPVKKKSPSPVKKKSPSPVKKKSPSPVKKKSPSPVSLPTMKLKPTQTLGMKLFGKKKAVVKNAAKTPGGRIKVKGPSGRLVYADSLKVQNLMNIATRLKVNTNGLTTKAMLAQAIFSKV